MVVLNSVVTDAGYAMLGNVGWAFGYGLVVVIAWYNWFRPLKFGDPTEPTEQSNETSSQVPQIDEPPRRL